MMPIVSNTRSSTSNCRKYLFRIVPYEINVSCRTSFRRSRSCIGQYVHYNYNQNTNQQKQQQQHIQRRHYSNSILEQVIFESQQQQLRKRYYLNVNYTVYSRTELTTSSLYSTNVYFSKSRKSNMKIMFSSSSSSSSSSLSNATTPKATTAMPPDGDIDTQQPTNLGKEPISITTTNTSTTTPEITSLTTITEVSNGKSDKDDVMKDIDDNEEKIGKKTTETLEQIQETYEIVQNIVKDTTYEYHRRISKRNQIKQNRYEQRRRYNERRHPSHPLYVKSLSKVLADRRTVLDILFPNPYRYDIDPNSTTIRQEIKRFFNHILYDKEYQTRLLNLWTLYKATWVGFRKPGFFPESEEDRIKNELKEKEEEIRKQKEKEEEEEAKNNSKNKKSSDEEVTGFSIGNKTFTSLSDITSNVQRNIGVMMNEKENIQTVVHTNTGIKNFDDIKALAHEYMSLATNCINEFISGYKVGRDSEMNKMITSNNNFNEYFPSLLSSTTTPSTTTTTEQQKETEQKKRPTTASTVTAGDNEDSIVNNDIVSATTTTTTTTPITEQVRRKKRKVKKRIINPYSY